MAPLFPLLRGSATGRVVGQRLVRLFEPLISALPFVDRVHHVTKRFISVSCSSPEGGRGVVPVDFPSPDMKAIGILTCPLPPAPARCGIRRGTGRRLRADSAEPDLRLYRAYAHGPVPPYQPDLRPSHVLHPYRRFTPLPNQIHYSCEKAAKWVSEPVDGAGPGGLYCVPGTSRKNIIMTERHHFEAIVFDLLTALLDSWTLWNDVAESEEDGRRWRGEYLKLTYECGRYRPYEDIIRDAAERAGIPPSAAETLMVRWPGLRPWPEAAEVFASLQTFGVPMGIATNCSNALAEQAVKCANAPFAAVATAESAGFYKPRPEPYRLVLEKLGTDPARTLFVAGSAADVPGATAVGMPVYWHNRVGLPAVDDLKPLRTERSLMPILEMF
ncbi:MAG: 2-haloacid dehalogenase [Gammaproteobacteria bacterium]|jgi:2-haloacid dehalogenase